MAALTLTIDGVLCSARPEETVLDAARAVGITIPTLCHYDGLTDVGACRLCLVEIEGQSKLHTACTLKVAEGMVVHTQTDRLRVYRKTILELLFAERNHVCAVCVANGNCELQDLAVTLGMDHVRFDYRYPQLAVDLTHARFGLDHNRCILCSRCVRVCHEVEGAHTWDIAGRGINSWLVSDLNQPWGDSTTCTSCGKCVQVCPTGALFPKGTAVGEIARDRRRVALVIAAREHNEWPV